MRKITRKSEIKDGLQVCFAAYDSDGLEGCLYMIEEQFLSNKVKFPLLEYCAECFYERFSDNEQIELCDSIEKLKTEGGNVILGMLLQKRLPDHFESSLQKATEYIESADIWYVCDIIGERVFGYSLLTEPQKTLPKIKLLMEHPSKWVVRSLGAGVHYAIKKGLEKKYVEQLFRLLLLKADSRDKEIRQGIGWAAKTTARFHPDIISKFQASIDDTEAVSNWFRTKISIGLNRNNYAQRN